jgi:Fe-S-cluster-containing dehydrogenase component
MTRLAPVADLDRCTGCLSCVVACKQEHRMPLGLSFMRVDQVGPHGRFPDLNMYYLPIACQQCREPSCADACPDGAIRRADDGLVAVVDEQCTGCGACVDACPYGAIVLDPAQKLARKCDLCAGLRAAGAAPACVAACPAKALAVVDADEGGSEPSEREAGGHERTGGRHERASFALMPSLGTLPSARYVLTRQQWRDAGEPR